MAQIVIEPSVPTLKPFSVNLIEFGRSPKTIKKYRYSNVSMNSAIDLDPACHS